MMCQYLTIKASLSWVELISLNWYKMICVHYIDVIITTIASQITSLTVVYSTVYSDADQRKHQSSASLAFVWGIHRDRWIPRTKDQLRGKCFHLMTSSLFHRLEVCYSHVMKTLMTCYLLTLLMFLYMALSKVLPTLAAWFRNRRLWCFLGSGHLGNISNG